MEKRFYDIHVFISRNNGFSIPVVIEDDSIQSDEDIINYAVYKNMLDSEDADNVDYVDEITEQDYLDMK